MRNKEASPRCGAANAESLNGPLTCTLDPNADRLAVGINDRATIGDEELLTPLDRIF